MIQSLKNICIKVTLLLNLVVLSGHSLKAQFVKTTEAEVPADVVKSFKASGKCCSQYITASWYVEKSGTNVLYQASFTNIGFESYIYNKKGNLLYSILESAKQTNISAEFKKAADKYKDLFVSKYTEVTSEKYKFKGYTITYKQNGEIKFIHLDKDGNAITQRPLTQIKNTIFADKTNF